MRIVVKPERKSRIKRLFCLHSYGCYFDGDDGTRLLWTCNHCGNTKWLKYGEYHHSALDGPVFGALTAIAFVIAIVGLFGPFLFVR